jgi:hypothetical protein
LPDACGVFAVAPPIIAVTATAVTAERARMVRMCRIVDS